MPVATPSADSHHSLALPRAAVAALAPRPYLQAHLLPPASPGASPPVRPDGRAPSSFRRPVCHTGSLTHCAGSAVVRVGDTAVVCGVQAELLLADALPQPPLPPAAINEQKATRGELALQRLLVPNVELATGCSPSYLPGSPPSSDVQALSRRILTLLHSSGLVDVNDLRITDTSAGPASLRADASEQTVAYWVLYCSIHVLSLSGSSSLFDVCWASLVAALANVRLPRAWWDPDVAAGDGQAAGGVLCSPLTSHARRLSIRGRPFACTWAVFEAADQASVSSGKSFFLADPNDLEDTLCLESVTLVVDGSRDSNAGGSDALTILRVEKSGGGVLGIDELRLLYDAARARWAEWYEAIPAIREP